MTAQYVTITHVKKWHRRMWPWSYAAKVRFYDQEQFALHDASTGRARGEEITVAQILESNSPLTHVTTSD